MIKKIKWNKCLEKWVMIDKDGFNIFEFPDCPRFNLQFPDLDKTKLNIYNDEPAKRIGEDGFSS